MTASKHKVGMVELVKFQFARRYLHGQGIRRLVYSCVSIKAMMGQSFKPEIKYLSCSAVPISFSGREGISPGIC